MWIANGRNLAPQHRQRSQDGSNRKVLNTVPSKVLGKVLEQ